MKNLLITLSVVSIVLIVACKKVPKQAVLPTRDYREQYTGTFYAEMVQGRWSNWPTYVYESDTAFDTITIKYDIKDSVLINGSNKLIYGPAVSIYYSNGKGYAKIHVDENNAVIVWPDLHGRFAGTDSVNFSWQSGGSHDKTFGSFTAYRIK